MSTSTSMGGIRSSPSSSAEMTEIKMEWTQNKPMIIFWIGAVVFSSILCFVAFIRLWKLFVVNRKKSYEIDSEAFAFLNILRHININDFGICFCFGIPHIFRSKQPWTGGESLCQLVWFLQNALIFASFLIAVVLAATSVLSMIALRKNGSINTRRINGLVILAYTGAVLFAIFPMFRHEGLGKAMDTEHNRVVDICSFVFDKISIITLSLYAIPPLLIIGLHTASGILRHKTRMIDGRMAENPFEKRRLSLAAVFLYFWLLVVIKKLVDNSHHMGPRSGMETPAQEALHCLLFLKCIISSCMLIGFSSDELNEANLTFKTSHHHDNSKRYSVASKF